MSHSFPVGSGIDVSSGDAADPFARDLEERSEGWAVSVVDVDAVRAGSRSAAVTVTYVIEDKSGRLRLLHQEI